MLCFLKITKNVGNTVVGKRNGAETNVKDFLGFALLVDVSPFGLAFLVHSLGNFQFQIVYFELVHDMESLKIRRQTTR